MKMFLTLNFIFLFVDSYSKGSFEPLLSARSTKITVTIMLLLERTLEAHTTGEKKGDEEVTKRPTVGHSVASVAMGICWERPVESHRKGFGIGGQMCVLEWSLMVFIFSS